ncbi:CoA-binding protein [Candidatus Magnetaquicoccus inordinatus]|uniref:CoA-binding protein n=1 Tax=Candidatus Magnetaquicoccus inordinatus TaxID=2496818 RepID=UPI001D0EE1CB|nr:CoA-binding protein [Candidatus Magnetaquicoccus inordinatus]
MSSSSPLMDNLSDTQLLDILRRARTIAVVGLSPKTDRPSYRVAAYLQQVGYKIIPVRPASEPILGEPCFPSLDAIPKEWTVDIVDVFRAADDTPPIAEAAVRLMAGQAESTALFWLQSGIIHEGSLTIARQGGLSAIQDRCLMVEHRRLLAQ